MHLIRIVFAFPLFLCIICVIADDAPPLVKNLVSRLNNKRLFSKQVCEVDQDCFRLHYHKHISQIFNMSAVKLFNKDFAKLVRKSYSLVQNASLELKNKCLHLITNHSMIDYFTQLVHINASALLSMPNFNDKAINLNYTNNIILKRKLTESIRKSRSIKQHTQHQQQINYTVEDDTTSPFVSTVTFHAMEDISNETSELAISQPEMIHSWGGLDVSTKECEAIESIRSKIATFVTEIREGGSTSYINVSIPWLTTHGTDVEILRFLRSKGGVIEDAWKAVLKHSQWRVSSEGADTVVQRNTYENNVMTKEVFWLGIDRYNCPTLVIRTQAHDGKHYEEDPKLFVRFIVWMLEQGKTLYGVGQSRQLSVILDRSAVPWLGPKEEKFDMRILNHQLSLFRLLYQTIMDHYPELIIQVKVMPVSWVFRMCFAVTSRLLEAHNRAKFHMVKPDQQAAVMLDLFDASLLPPHFGGTSLEYGSISAYSP